jgi:hypothetical protein
VGVDAVARDGSDAPGLSLVGNWSAESAASGSVPDDSGYARSPIVLRSGAVIDTAGDASIQLDGSTGYADLVGPVVDETGSFTVSVRVRADVQVLATKPVGYRAQVVGQRISSSAPGHSWALWYERAATGDRWYFGRTGADGSGAVLASVPSEDVANDGVVDLTGVYEATDGEIRLYVADARQRPEDQQEAFTVASQGAGEFAVGRGHLTTAADSYFAGDVMGVRVWAGGMSPAQLSEVVGE